MADAGGWEKIPGYTSHASVAQALGEALLTVHEDLATDGPKDWEPPPKAEPLTPQRMPYWDLLRELKRKVRAEPDEPIHRWAIADLLEEQGPLAARERTVVHLRAGKMVCDSLDLVLARALWPSVNVAREDTRSNDFNHEAYGQVETDFRLLQRLNTVASSTLANFADAEPERRKAMSVLAVDEYKRLWQLAMEHILPRLREPGTDLLLPVHGVTEELRREIEAVAVARGLREEVLAQ